MSLKRFLAACAFAALAPIAITANAAPCGGFTDVDSTQASVEECQSVEWVKNRSVTLGCTSTTLYCPTGAVTRLTMALFMKRLGTALTPITIRKRDPALGALNFSTVRTMCATDQPDVPQVPLPPPGSGYQILSTGYPQKAVVTALLNAFTLDTGGMNLKASIVYSTDGGATWLVPPTNDGTAFGSLYAGMTPPDDISLRAHTVIDLARGQSYRFAVQGVRTSPTGGGANANAYCEVHVEIVNRNPTSSPFDVVPDPGPHGRGD